MSIKRKRSLIDSTSLGAHLNLFGRSLSLSLSLDTEFYFPIILSERQFQISIDRSIEILVLNGSRNYRDTVHSLPPSLFFFSRWIIGSAFHRRLARSSSKKRSSLLTFQPRCIVASRKEILLPRAKRRPLKNFRSRITL